MIDWGRIAAEAVKVIVYVTAGIFTGIFITLLFINRRKDR